jgi:hypothetical protein
MFIVNHICLSLILLFKFVCFGFFFYDEKHCKPESANDIYYSSFLFTVQISSG